MEMKTLKPLLKAVKSLEARIEERGGPGRPIPQEELISTMQEMVVGMQGMASYIQNPQQREDVLSRAKEFLVTLENMVRR